jgi:alpha-L-fucosidase
MGRSPGRRLRTALAAMLVGVGAMTAVALTSTPAGAELQHPRQQFLRDSTAGLFLHWGLRTSPSHNSCGGWEKDVTNGGWTPEYWVNEGKKLHVQYLVLASFHSRLGYARAWPSSIPGSCSTSRDFLGELITAADKQGMKVILYMTDDPQWHDEGGNEWLNSKAYSTYKGHTVDLTTRDGFGQFSYDNFVEVMQRYPNLGGFWIDNDNQYWIDHGLYERIRSERPSFTLSNNNEDTPIMDMISNEQKTGMTPPYDYPQKVYTAAPRLIEADFKLPSSGAWWFDGSNPSVDRKLTLGRLITNAGSSIKALMAETAQVNGRFPSNQEAFNNFADTYLNQIWESLGGTEGGGYMYGGLKPGRWNSNAYGVTTISKSDPDLQYIHVIDPPTSGSSLVVRDNGYAVTRVTNLRTGATVGFTQGGGNLTLTGLSGWDPYDTVFKVETAGRMGIYPPSTYTMTASSSAGGHAAAAAADGNYLTYWDNNNRTSVTLDYNLGATRRVQYIGINQREDSVVSGGTSNRIRDYRVYVSGNGTSWGSPVRTGTLPNARGVAIIDLPATQTRYVRLDVVNTQAGSRLRIDESWIGSDYAPGGSPPPPPPNRLEAENATISQGVVESNHAGFSGTGFVNYDNLVGSYVEWTVNSVSAGTVALTLRYANGTTVNRPMDITVNGAVVARGVAFNGTGTWDTWADAMLNVPLVAGANTVRATATTASGGPNVDHLDVAS